MDEQQGTVPSRAERGGTVTLCAVTLASVTADSFLVVTLTWTLTVRGQSAVLGGVLAVLAVARLVLMPLGGVIADRLPRRRILTVTCASRALGAVALAVSMSRGAIGWTFVAAAFLGVVSAVHYPADRAVVVDIVTPDSLAWANGWLTGAMQIGQMVGPLAAGAVITAAGYRPSFYAAAACYLLASSLLWVLHTPQASIRAAARPGMRTALGAELAAGIRIVGRDAALLTLLLVIAVQNLGFVGPMAVGLPALVYDTLGLGAQWFTIVQVAFALGSLVGALLAARLPIAQTGPGIVGCALASFAAIGACAIAPLVGVTIALMTIAGLASGLLNVGVITVLQRVTAPDYLGRVMSLVTMASLGLGPVSQAIAGAAVATWSGGAVLAGGALLSLVLTVAMTPLLLRASARLIDRPTTHTETR